MHWSERVRQTREKPAAAAPKRGVPWPNRVEGDAHGGKLRRLGQDGATPVRRVGNAWRYGPDSKRRIAGPLGSWRASAKAAVAPANSASGSTGVALTSVRA
jgi:hypothetical protein